MACGLRSACLHQRKGRLVGGGVHGVSHRQGLGLAPNVPDGGFVPPHLVPVLNVIVHQGKVVDELEGQGCGHGPFPSAAEGLTGEEA